MKEIKDIKLLKVYKIKENYFLYVFENDFEKAFEFYISNEKYGIMQQIFGILKNYANSNIDYWLENFDFAKYIDTYKKDFED